MLAHPHREKVLQRSLRAIRLVLGATFVETPSETCEPINRFSYIELLKDRPELIGKGVPFEGYWAAGHLRHPYSKYFAKVILDNTSGPESWWFDGQEEIRPEWAHRYFGLLEEIIDPGLLVSAVWIEAFKAEAVSPGCIPVSTLETLTHLEELDLELLSACAFAAVSFRGGAHALLLNSARGDQIALYIREHPSLRKLEGMGLLVEPMPRQLTFDAPGICRTSDGPVAFTPRTDGQPTTLDLGFAAVGASAMCIAWLLASGRSKWKSLGRTGAVAALQAAGLEAVAVEEGLYAERR